MGELLFLHSDGAVLRPVGRPNAEVLAELPRGVSLAAEVMRPDIRTIPQNKRMRAMLADLSRAQPEGRQHDPEVWKALMMQACGHQVQFAIGLDGLPFPTGFRSSDLTRAQMSNLMEFMSAWGIERGVLFREPVKETA